MVIELPNIYLISCSEHSLNVAFFFLNYWRLALFVWARIAQLKVSMYSFNTTMAHLEISLL